MRQQTQNARCASEPDVVVAGAALVLRRWSGVPLSFRALAVRPATLARGRGDQQPVPHDTVRILRTKLHPNQRECTCAQCVGMVLYCCSSQYHILNLYNYSQNNHAVSYTLY